jgi:hypothetical protein
VKGKNDGGDDGVLVMASILYICVVRKLIHYPFDYIFHYIYITNIAHINSATADKEESHVNIAQQCTLSIPSLL